MHLRFLAIVIMGICPIAHSGCLTRILAFLKISSPTIEAAARADYQQFVSKWQSKFPLLTPDSLPKAVAEAPGTNTKNHRLYTAQVQGKDVVYKSYDQNSKKTIHEMAMLQVCNNLGIPSISIRGYTLLDGNVTYATHFIDGSILGNPDGRVRFMNHSLTRTPGQITSTTLTKLEEIAGKLKGARIQAKDLQFLITPTGEPFLIDVGEFFFDAEVEGRARTAIPEEGWTELYMGRFRRALAKFQ